MRAGLPSFTVVGLADAAVREARARIQAAIRNSGFEFPARRITANLAPGGVPKAGPGLDLALACAVMAASGQLPPHRLQGAALLGELGLDGSVRPVHGALAIAGAARESGMARLLLAPAAARGAVGIEGVELCPVGCLKSAMRVLAGGPADAMPARPRVAAAAGSPPELAEVRGQDQAVRALIVAAAGGHNCLFSGPPGTGKTMLAQRLPGILPALTLEEAIEVARIHMLAGAGAAGTLAGSSAALAGAEVAATLTRTPPFRAPHHSISAAGLVGGARPGAVGEAVLAHNGVLFLDELSEFSRSALDALREPLEDGRAAIARAGHSSIHPTRFMLLAATNPCPCGRAGEPGRCSCSPADLARHTRRLSGPLLDRIDLRVALHRCPRPEHPEPLATSAHARVLVREARERQRARLRLDGAVLNARMGPRLLRRHARLDEPGLELVAQARRHGLLSARGEQRVLRVARTVADLAASPRVQARHVAEALALRGAAPLPP